MLQPDPLAWKLLLFGRKVLFLKRSETRAKSPAASPLAALVLVVDDWEVRLLNSSHKVSRHNNKTVA